MEWKTKDGPGGAITLSFGARRENAASPRITLSSHSTLSSRGLERRIVGVSLLGSAVEGGLVGIIQSRVRAQALHEIGVGDEQLAEGDEIGAAGRHRLLRELQRVAVVGDIGALEALPERGRVEGKEIARAAGRAFDDMHEKGPDVI